MTAAPVRERLDDLTRRWRVRLERILSTRTSLLAFGTRLRDPVVLKIVRAHGDEWDAGAVAAAFDGHGVVRVLEHEPGAVLTEWLRPGRPLVELVRAGDDDAATGVVADVIGAMREVDPDPAGRPTAGDLARSFETVQVGPASALPPAWIDQARAVHAELCASQGPVRLLHGDLHHGNIVFDERRSWQALDPKGVIAETEYEVAACLRNPPGPPDLQTAAAARRRIERLCAPLALDAERALRWAWCLAVLSAVWSIEDDGSVDPSGPALRLAGALEPLVA